MQLDESLGVFGRCHFWRRGGPVITPKRHDEAVSNVDLRRHARIEYGCRAACFGQPSNYFDFKFRAGFVLAKRDASQNVAWRETKSESIRILEDDHILDVQAER